MVSATVAAQLREMLTVTVETAPASCAQVEGYEVAGKTGTAQKVKEDGSGYDEDRFVASFVGMVPADDPAPGHPGDGGRAGHPAPRGVRGGAGLRQDRRLRPQTPGHRALDRGLSRWRHQAGSGPDPTDGRIPTRETQ